MNKQESFLPHEREKPPFEAVICDKDGTLILTEEVYVKAWRRTIANFWGNGDDYTWELHLKHIGFPSSVIAERIRENFRLPIGVRGLVDFYRPQYYQIFEEEGVGVPEGAKEFINWLKLVGIKCALATGASRRNTDFTLRKAGLDSLVEIIVTSEDVERGKPAPDLFLLAAEKLKVPPGGCLVLGDTFNDVLAAKAAGMRVLLISQPSKVGNRLDQEKPHWEAINFQEAGRIAREIYENSRGSS